MHPVRMLLDELPELLVEPGRVLGTSNTHAGDRWMADSRVRNIYYLEPLLVFTCKFIPHV